MRLSASWLLLACLSVCACSDDDKGQSESAVEADASMDEDTKSEEGSAGKKSSGSAGKGGSGGSKSTSSGKGDKAPASDSKDDAKSDDDSKGEKPANGDDDKKPEGESESESDKPDSPDDADSDNSKTDEEAKPSESGPPTHGNQLSVCSMIEGDCNQGLACQAPAGPFSAGRGFCSKICQEDADCSGLAPEGTKYTCSTGSGTHTCEIACTSAEDASCPSGLACVQTGARRRPAPAADAGTPEAEGDAGTTRTSAFEPVFHCRHPFAVSKIWESCNDATNVCGEGLLCASAFWFGGAGHCTKSCEADSDCAKPEAGGATPTCLTLVPAIGENPPVKQCVLDCAAAADSCPSNLSCFWGPETRGEMGAESTPAFAWCQ